MIGSRVMMTDSSSLPNNRRVAYFSMEIALRPDLPTYSGGLGVLAGDMLRSAADLAVPIVGVTLVTGKATSGSGSTIREISRRSRPLEAGRSARASDFGLSLELARPARPGPGLAIHPDRHFGCDRAGLFARHRSA